MRGNFLTGCKPVSFSRRAILHGVGEEGSKIYYNKASSGHGDVQNIQFIN